MKPWALDLRANPRNDGVRFRVWAPKVTSLSLKVIGERGEIPMELEEKGYFAAFVKGLAAGARYYYSLGGGRLRPDPVSRYQPEGVHGPSEVIDPDQFLWEDDGWEGIPVEEMILYEIHTGTFTPDGTFESVIPLLDYLKDELGITAIELMPVAQFSGERNWGYDGTYLFAPQNSYGGPAGLKSLVNVSHRKGLAVILDVVYNHLGPEGNYLDDFGPYFTDRYRTPWGSAINFDGPWSDDVRRFVVENALHWVTEYHIDGLRIDAIHGIFDFSATHILEEIREAVHRQGKNLGRCIIVIAESSLNDVRVINPTSRGGYGLDAQWNDDFHHCLHTLLTGERNGYYEDFGEFNHLVKAIREGFVYSGQYSSYRKRRHGNSSKHLPPLKFVVFSQNHDQVGNRFSGDRLSTLVSFEALKLAAGIVLLSPNIPLLFMGEEYGEEAPFQYFVSHSDPALIESVRKGRQEEFAAFGWGEAIPDPQDAETFLRSKIHPDLRRSGRHEILFRLYQQLIRLRKEIPVLSCLDGKGMKVKPLEKERGILIERRYKEDRVICLFNLSEHPGKAEVRFEKGSWQRIFASASEEWGGMGTLVPQSILSTGSKILFALNGYAYALYRKSEE